MGNTLYVDKSGTYVLTPMNNTQRSLFTHFTDGDSTDLHHFRGEGATTLLLNLVVRAAINNPKASIGLCGISGDNSRDLLAAVNTLLRTLGVVTTLNWGVHSRYSYIFVRGTESVIRIYTKRAVVFDYVFLDNYRGTFEPSKRTGKVFSIKSVPRDPEMYTKNLNKSAATS